MTTFVTADRRLAVVIGDNIRSRLIAHCARAGRNETGGVLVGRYTDLHDQALITEVSGPPRDSIHMRVSFIRGLVGLQRRIDRAWRRHDYYLGEWHFHPYMDATPSDRDRKQITAFARDPAYACPQPILIVIGGDPSDNPEFHIGVVDGQTLLDLHPSDEVYRPDPTRSVTAANEDVTRPEGPSGGK